MKIEIKRYIDEKVQKEEWVSYDLDADGMTLFEALSYIKANQDPSLSFSSGCRSGVCGSCGVRVNEKEQLMCSYKVKDGDRVEALANMPVVRDLIVDITAAQKTISNSKAWLDETHTKLYNISHEASLRNELQSDCILCGSCYSACPVFSVKESFLGPFALTRVLRYVADERECDEKSKIDRVQTDGIWDCTLCNECTFVCPQDISSKADIEKLRAKSAQHGYMDPNFSQSFGGGFGGGFDGSPTF